MNETRSRNPDASASIFKPGENCWRVARAEKLALIIDAADYFRMLRGIFLEAKRELLLIGWDFDFEIEMLPGESDGDGLAPDGYPNTLGPFLEAVVARTPELHIYMLKWNGAVLVAPGRFLPTVALDIFGDDRIHFALDGHHPFGACHHQKIIVADNTFAFCGGIDTTAGRWDTPEHLPGDPRRALANGTISEPWHDATSALTGPVAEALGELSRNRWRRATGEELVPPDDVRPILWPDHLHVDAENVEVAIARTGPPFDGEELTNEIERLILDSIAAARHVIYVESQYFAAESICEALEARLREESGPEIVVVNPEAALAYVEDRAMHVLRGRLVERLRAADHGDRFRIYHPVNREGEPIYVHAKIFIVDDQILRIGSSNLNDRSLGFDTECDIAFEGERHSVRAFRARLLAEHLAVPVEKVEATLDEKGTLIGAIESLRVEGGRALRPIERVPEDLLGEFLADTRLFDPRYEPGEPAAAGHGLRPRHLALIAGAAGLGLVAWLVWRHRSLPR
ncbi:phospholipase D-like domain-containing protein [uncultured Jannaschia sp.]|uniref:phospholipase D-like domain-containing protein n=1 Tax=uncultured Jannaschia sp. TaxID=293347 RepID=UPI00262FC839|nr:phospholipase D-like domain-containing protein [uncultured Jannaschia sp.]